jgi:hypothetical protein
MFDLVLDFGFGFSFKFVFYPDLNLPLKPVSFQDTCQVALLTLEFNKRPFNGRNLTGAFSLLFKFDFDLSFDFL